jgi:hypothetical protein
LPIPLSTSPRKHRRPPFRAEALAFLSVKRTGVGARPCTILGAAVALVLLPSMASFAADASRQVPPPHFPLNVAPPAQLTLAPSSSVALGQFTVVFGETSLGAVLKQVKVGRVDHAGDASESVYWLCYSICTTKARERMWMLSHGEMDGPSRVIYGVVAIPRIASSQTTQEPRTGVPRNSSSSASFRLDSAIRWSSSCGPRNR